MKTAYIFSSLLTAAVLVLAVCAPLAYSSHTRRGTSHHRRNVKTTSTTATATTTTTTTTSTTTTRTTTTMPSNTIDELELLMSSNSNGIDQLMQPEPAVMAVIEAPLSGTIFLHCPVDIDDDFQVSWVRLPDWRIVASGRHVYGHKEVERLRVLAPPTSPSAQVEANGGTMMAARAEWTLQIKYASLEDQGLYECQVATATGIVTHYFNVSVVVPTTTIAGLGSGSLAASGEQQQREYHVDKGSAIQLSCLIHNIPQEPQFIFWYHNDRMINYDDSYIQQLHDHHYHSDHQHHSFRRLPRVQVITESTGSNDQPRHDHQQTRVVTSHLTIRNVTEADSGNYTCAPSNAEPASTIVYVSEGDDAAAAIHVGLGENGSNASSEAAGVVVLTPAAAAAASSSSTSTLSISTASFWMMLPFISRFHR